ncbi:MAG TPA: hypothetical protein VIF57_07295 [Polyangia bacterium]|jgi:hypothetical protein
MGRSKPRAPFLLVGAISGCLSSSDPAAGDGRPRLWTLFDLRAALAAGGPVAVVPSRPQGIDAREVLAPADGGGATLKVIPAYSEGQPAAYVMPEVWTDFDEVWVQPWYVLVTAWDQQNPMQNRAKTADGMNAPAVFDVGPHSLFYSPLWTVYYAVLPVGADATAYRSAEKIFDDELEIHPGVLWTYSLRPDDVGLGAAPPVHPYLQTPVASFLNTPAAGWVDGEQIAYFGEGSNNFTTGAGWVVEETPLYELAQRGPDGAPQPLGAPRVMGTGPPFAGVPADAPAGRPRFGSYSRIYEAVAPATAAAFDPGAAPDAAALLTAQGLNPEAYRGRVAANAVKIASADVACFAAPDFPSSCSWLDSQARIEASLGAANIVRTEVTACTPLVFYDGKGIGR